MEILRTRPAARVICLDVDDRVLLLRWRDPSNGAWLWEPPGGGIEPGETPFDAARRELFEETRLDPSAVGEGFAVVERDLRWDGARHVGPEQFFLARFDIERPEPRRSGLLPDEQVNLHAYAWVAWDGIDELADPVEPPQLLDVLRQLAPDGPWADWVAS
ncbi:MAG: NUDIX domain-containing protein [Actinophytocola sp.]|uniref:NUDIX hydrolase n=1 Tax=Actinophytocola sp. TaxID=1872138 RepID=UPI001325196D|nr:NUDIX domain-containing protein [Actinophytocola sp.]MPZ85201.1 NUDIX domain-containing protein [Actinophytocola sp.]